MTSCKRCGGDLMCPCEPDYRTLMHPERALEIAARLLPITVEKLRSRDRSSKTVAKRDLAIYVVGRLSGQSLSEICLLFGRDRSTLCSSIDRITAQMRARPEFAATVARFEKQCRNWREEEIPGRRRELVQ